jgi:hypothetical protein
VHTQRDTHIHIRRERENDTHTHTQREREREKERERERESQKDRLRGSERNTHGIVHVARNRGILPSVCLSIFYLAQVLDEVAEVVPADNQSNRRYKLRKEAWGEFDPYFARYTPEQLNLALERATVCPHQVSTQMSTLEVKQAYIMHDLKLVSLNVLNWPQYEACASLCRASASRHCTHIIAMVWPVSLASP